MCGICGWAGAAPDARRLEAAMERLAHRGPDQEGRWAGERAMLGHRRLSVIDLSPCGRQPMANETGTVQVVFNGMIYNHQALRAQLEGRHAFRSNADTEVLVHGYEEWGIEGLVRRISGMYAFAVWDAAAETLHLVRDRLGKKPLFYAAEGGRVAFASTLPALLDLLPTAPEVRPDALRDYLLHLCVPGDASIVRGVHKLPPAHRLELRGGRVSVERYWSLSFARQEDRPAEEWIEAIDETLHAAVERRLEADVPLGIFLSGGVDSSLVAAVAARKVAGRVTTLSAGFAEAGFSELPHARRVAEHLGADHHELVVGAQDASILPHLVFAAGEPFGDQALLPTLYLARAAREHATVVLTGDGGDEAFGGYPSPVVARVGEHYRRLFPAALRRRAVPDLLEWVERRGGRTGVAARRLRRVAVPAAGPGGFRWTFDPLAERGFRGRFDGLFTRDFAARLGERDPDAHWLGAYAAADGPTAADRVLQTEMLTLLPDQFLVKSDVATMAFAIEARSPFLDVELVELAARIPARVKTAGLESKHLLKRLAARYVPRSAVYRPKQGFRVPAGAWLRGPLGAEAESVLLSEAALGRGIFAPGAVASLVDEHRAGRADHGSRLWLLFVLELWMQIFVDRTLSPSERLPLEAAA